MLCLQQGLNLILNERTKEEITNCILEKLEMINFLLFLEIFNIQ